jgi:hypothetical protein
MVPSYGTFFSIDCFTADARDNCSRNENLVHIQFASLTIANFEAETAGVGLTVVPIKPVGIIFCYPKTLEEHESYRSTLLGPAQPPANR